MSRARTEGQYGAIFGRELRAFFLSPISYLVWFLFLVAVGWLFAGSIRDHGPCTLAPTFEWTALLLAVVVPLLTMRLVADEHRLGTLEALLTDPVRERTIVLAKYFASLLFLVVMIAPTLAFPLVLKSIGEPDPGPILGGYLGLLLFGALFVAIGLLASIVTMNPIGAAALAFAVLLILWLLGLAANAAAPGAWRDVLEYLSAFRRFESFREGVVDSRSVAWCLSLVALTLTNATFALSLRRRR
jgi:ABC-2 type transport system permease protein